MTRCNLVSWGNPASPVTSHQMVHSSQDSLISLVAIRIGDSPDSDEVYLCIFETRVACFKGAVRGRGGSNKEKQLMKRSAALRRIENSKLHKERKGRD